MFNDRDDAIVIESNGRFPQDRKGGTDDHDLQNVVSNNDHIPIEEGN